MTTPTSGGSGGGLAPVWGAAALAGVLVAAAVAFVSLLGGQDEVAPSVTDIPASVASTPAAGDASPEPGAQPPAPPADETAGPVAPRFDLVRVDPAGNTVVAGRAEPRATVTLRLDGDRVEVIQADEAGSFVAMLALSPSASPRVLSLEAAAPGSDPLQSAETVLIAPVTGEAVAALDTGSAPSSVPFEVEPPAAPEPAPRAEDAPEPEVPPAPEPVADAPVPAPEPAPTPDAALAEETGALAEVSRDAGGPAAPIVTPQAPAVLLAGEDGLRVLQGPGQTPDAQTSIQLDAITYDIEGDVTIAGRGPAEASVRVTLNNEPINMGEVGPGGQWSLELPDVDPGTYTLRVEQLAVDGTVERSVETPFLREDPQRIRANPMLVDPGASVITVQRGFTLWGIAEANFGDGILYVQIFEENRGEIRDPDLIFPGQIFALPDLPRRSGDD